MFDYKLHKYEIYLNTEQIPICKVAEVILAEQKNILEKMSFKYTLEYLKEPKAFSIDPVHFPLQIDPFNLNELRSSPSILDDYLPDDWGRTVIAKQSFYQFKKKIDVNNDIDMLNQLSSSRIGAIVWVKQGEKPIYELGCSIDKLTDAEDTAQKIADSKTELQQFDEFNLLYLASNGSGVGGARPKALVNDDKAYLAKFNWLNKDEYNNARVELLCLKLAKLAGLNAPFAKVLHGINKRDVLLIERFDVDQESKLKTRSHLITINAMRKHENTHQDERGVFRYDDIADFIKQYSVEPIEDLEMLLRMMLFNAVINNMDTHDRNFSFINNGNGYRLSPVYDVVPMLGTGIYPEAGYQYSANPPHPKDIEKYGNVFGLSKPRCKLIASEVIAAFDQLPNMLNECRLSKNDINSVMKVFKL